MACLLVAVLCTSESRIVFLHGSGNFGACCSFPLIHCVGNFIPIQCFTVNSFAKAFPEPYNSSFSIKGPDGCEGEPFKGGYVGVDVPPGHGELH